MTQDFLNFGLPLNLIIGFVGGLITGVISNRVGNSFRTYVLVIVATYIFYVEAGAVIYLIWNFFSPETIDFGKSFLTYCASFGTLYGSLLFGAWLTINK